MSKKFILAMFKMIANELLKARHKKRESQTTITILVKFDTDEVLVM